MNYVTRYYTHVRGLSVLLALLLGLLIWSNWDRVSAAWSELPDMQNNAAAALPDNTQAQTVKNSGLPDNGTLHVAGGNGGCDKVGTVAIDAPNMNNGSLYGDTPLSNPNETCWVLFQGWSDSPEMRFVLAVPAGVGVRMANYRGGTGWWFSGESASIKAEMVKLSREMWVRDLSYNTWPIYLLIVGSESAVYNQEATGAELPLNWVAEPNPLKLIIFAVQPGSRLGTTFVNNSVPVSQTVVAPAVIIAATNTSAPVTTTANTPASAATVTPPANAQSPAVKGQCSVSGQHMGPAILEGPGDGNGATQKLDEGETAAATDWPTCWPFDSQSALTERWPGHQAEFSAHSPNGAKVD